MKLVKEHINEKFTEDSDPVKDLGIGLYMNRTFETREDMYEWLSDNLPAIIGTKSIPKNILNDPHPSGYMIHHKYQPKIIKYVHKYLSITGESRRAELWPGWFADFLRKKYPYLDSWNAKINEKFEQDSDPISDMEIGLTEDRIKYKIDNQNK